MSELVFERLSDESLEEIAGGMTPELRAAYAVIRGEFGNGQERMDRLTWAGYDAKRVQNLVNSLLKYESVANDVIAGKYDDADDATLLAASTATIRPASTICARPATTPMLSRIWSTTWCWITSCTE